MRYRYWLFVALFLMPQLSRAQELFPLTEPASNMPKGVLGIRAFDQSYREPGNAIRNMGGIRLMYGVLPQLSVYVNGTVSNHHSASLPPDFPTHNTPQIGVPLPYRFNGINVYAKYRFLSLDGENTHFRATAYAEYGFLNVAHDEGEPNLMDDTKGGGGGLIATWLHKRFAVSFTGGVILPSPYEGVVPDPLPDLPGVPARVEYGRAVNYSLSFGYLLAPSSYKSYNQTNWNVYVEFLGKSYEGANVYFDNIGTPGTPYPVTGAGYQVLKSNSYVEMHPGVQAIIKSNLRLDLSVGLPVINRSYAHYYPMVSLGVQRYFYFKKKK